MDMVKIEVAHQVSYVIDEYFNQIIQIPAASDLPSGDVGLMGQAGPIEVSGKPAVLTEGDSMEIDHTSMASKYPLETNATGLEDRYTVVNKTK